MSNQELHNISKANLLTKYKDVIISNFESMCYPLFQVLYNDKAIELCQEFEEKAQKSKSSIPNCISYKDEIYVLHTLASYLDKAPLPIEKKIEAKKKVLSYTKYFDSKRAC